jgi:hypothetical protein
MYFLPFQNLSESFVITPLFFCGFYPCVARERPAWNIAEIGGIANLGKAHIVFSQRPRPAKSQTLHTTPLPEEKCKKTTFL